jgi:hypothetical protein
VRDSGGGIMQSWRRTVAGILWAALCTGACVGQAPTPSAAVTPAPPNETKNLVQGKVVQEPGGQGIRKVKVMFISYCEPINSSI